jgi:hypothetical protein
MRNDGDIYGTIEGGLAIGAAASQEDAGAPIRGAATDARAADAMPLGSLRDHGDAGTKAVPDGSEAKALGLALALHVAVFAALSLHLSDPPPPSSGAMSVSYVVVPGDPPPGDPKGDSKPPPKTVAEEKPAASAETPATDGITPAASDAAPSDSPSPDKAPDSSAQAASDGTGSLALGARTHGDAQGLDGDLMASVGQAIATRIRTCWTPPKEAPRDVAARIIARYAQDGTLEGDPIVVTGSDPAVPVASPDQWQMQAVDAMRRCSPIGLPAFLYPYWREVEVQVYST